MVFNSLEFVVFIVIVLTGYYLVLDDSRDRARKVLLLVASYAFYGSWNPAFTLLLAGSTVLDYFLGLRIAATDDRSRKRLLLFLSLLANLGVLGFFKYGDFFRDQVYAVLGMAGVVQTLPAPWNIILPVGISFYTFQTLSYSIDVYRGAQAPTRSFLDFALFVSFFPQLVAGPIVRSKHFLPQLENPRSVRASDAEDAMVRIFAGLVKKVVLADTLGEYVDQVFKFPRSYGSANVLLGIYAYTYQIYFDFSGYSDIAIGLARLFGFHIPENFNRPYLSSNPREFWQRWHISLSTWLRDYLYVSLGGNRGSGLRTYRNLAATMLLGGLWHGASWNFVIWGAFHGIWLAMHRFWTSGTMVASTRWLWIKRLLTFHMVCLGWVFFRASTFDDAILLLSRLTVWQWTSHSSVYVAAILVVVSLMMHFVAPPLDLRRRYRELPSALQGVGYGLAVISFFLFSASSGRFIYFQF